MNSIFDKIVEGVKAVAPTVANLVLPGSGTLLDTLMRAVTGDLPETSIEEVAAKIQANPQLYLQLQAAAMQHEVQMANVETARLQTVNATMQVEAKSEHWAQWGWRPFNGFLYPIAIIAVYFVLPICKVPIPAVPEWIWMGWGAILGVTTWGRNQLKRAKVGQPTPGLVDAAGRIQGQ